MASGWTAMLRRAAQDCLCQLCQASAEHFQQCAEFLPLSNRGLGALAVTVLPIALARSGAATFEPIDACLTARSVHRSRFRARHKSALLTMRFLAARP